ncbi:MAG: hypothetical protein H0T69_01115 [Thermoleophilaceae bacterium]|nr:hypothetical protein [Thermoleophilaceae bacterium]
MQGVFAVHHLGLVAGVVALALSGAVGRGGVGRSGAWLLVAGTVMLTASELLAMRYVGWTNEAANAGLMGAAYGISCTLMGVGAILAGIGVRRAKVWSGWRAWTPMVIGVAQFVMLTPGMFGGFVVARLVIGAWMLMFAALGAGACTPSRWIGSEPGSGLRRSPRADSGSSSPSASCSTRFAPASRTSAGTSVGRTSSACRTR